MMIVWIQQTTIFGILLFGALQNIAKLRLHDYEYSQGLVVLCFIDWVHKFYWNILWWKLN